MSFNPTLLKCSFLQDVLVGYDGETLHTFIVHMDNVAGPTVTFLGMMNAYCGALFDPL